MNRATVWVDYISDILQQVASKRSQYFESNSFKQMRIGKMIPFKPRKNIKVYVPSFRCIQFMENELKDMYSYYLQSLQRLFTRVCKYFRPESLHNIWLKETYVDAKVLLQFLIDNTTPTLRDRDS